MLKAFQTKTKNFLEHLRSLKENHTYTPAYRLVEITKNEHDEYAVTSQIINKSITFTSKPEEILAKDSLVDQFSPRDIRTLTYLGYLDINSPKYKVLAKRLSEKQDKLVFALKKKGDDSVIVKTADEIIKEKEILDNLGASDAHIVGYTVASEGIKAEEQEKERLLKQLAQKKAKPE
jgi:hypothetical protein